MADDLKRVGLVFKADGTVDFKKNLKEVNTSIQENRSAFKLAKSTWDENTKSIEKLTSTQKYLAEQTKDYSDKVKMLESELKDLENAEKRDEQAIQKKRDQLNTAKTSLNNYSKGLEEVNQKLKSGSAQMEEFAKKLEKTGEKLKKTGKTMTKGLTVPILAVGAAGIKSAMELDEGYDIIISKTGATGESLQELYDVADEVFGSMPVEMTDVGTAVGELNTRFGATGDALKDMTKDFMKFAEINEMDVNSSVQLVSRAMSDAGIGSDEYKTVLDSLTVAAQASGISMDSLTTNIAKYGAPMRALGLDTNESIAIFAGWEKAGVNTEIAFSGMKKAIGTWGKAGKDSREEFKKTLDEIKNCPDIASATTKAIEVFGQKAGPDLADAIQGGRFEFQEYLNLIQESAGIVESTWDAQQSPWDQMKTAMNNLKLAGAELGGVLFEVLAPIIQSVSEKVKQFSEWFRGLDEDQKKTIVTIGLVIAAIGPLLVIFGSVFSSVGKITRGTTDVINLVTEGGPKVVGAIKKIGGGAKALWAIMAANPIGAVVTVIGILVAGFITAYTKCEWFRDGVNKIFGGIVDFVKGAIDKIKKIFDFEWKLPKIKLPHFKISGGFSLSPLKVPSLAVKWYAKGGILNKPTIFGQNGNSLMGGGEAGKEAVLPIHLLKQYIREENQKNNSALAMLIKEALSELNICAENNVYIGDKKILSTITDMVIKKISSRMSNTNVARGM